MLAFLIRGQFSYPGYVFSHTRAVSYLSVLHVDHPTVIRTYDYSLALDLIIPILKGIRTYELLISSQ